MEGLLWVLAYALFFYFMMRFGCGSHMVHGHGGHGGHGGHDSESSHVGHSSGRGGATDPVCGMQVPSGEGYSRSYNGREFRFCSRDCLDRFDANPARYVG